jgi:hypothetical protein
MSYRCFETVSTCLFSTNHANQTTLEPLYKGAGISQSPPLYTNDAAGLFSAPITTA